MTKVLERAGASFLRVFGTSVLFFAPGILNAPDKGTAISLGVAAFAGSVAAGLRAVQEFVPQISWKSLVAGTPGALLDSFTRAFVGVFIAAETAWLTGLDLSGWKSAGIAAVVAAATAGVRAIQGLLTGGESPAPGAGL